MAFTFLRRHPHEHVVTMIDYYVADQHLHVVMPQGDDDLYNIVKGTQGSRGCLEEERVSRFLQARLLWDRPSLGGRRPSSPIGEKLGGFLRTRPFMHDPI